MSILRTRQDQPCVIPIGRIHRTEGGLASFAFPGISVLAVWFTVWFSTSATFADETAPGEGKTVTVKVAANRRFTPTGVMLKPGMVVRIEAAGTIEAAPANDGRAEYHNVPPEGRKDLQGDFPKKDVPPLCLLGRIGYGPIYYVGAGDLFTVIEKAGSGELLLGINQEDVRNNSGEWTVRITLVNLVSTSHGKPREILAGDYNLSIVLDPADPVAGRETFLHLRAYLTDSKQPVEDAIVVVRIQQDGSKDTQQPTEPVSFDPRSREYGCHLIFPGPGKHWIHVAVWQVGHHPVATDFAVEVAKTAGNQPAPDQSTIQQQTTHPADGVSSGGAAADVSTASSGSAPVALRDQIALETTAAGLLKVAWLQRDPRPSRVVFLLRDETGEEFARQTDTHEPFYGLFKKSYPIKTIEVQLEYSNGVTASVVYPYPPSTK